jgi:hypothetical protein
LPHRQSQWWWGSQFIKVDVCRFNGNTWDVILEYPINGYEVKLDDFWRNVTPYPSNLSIEDQSHEISPEQYQRKSNAEA